MRVAALAALLASPAAHATYWNVFNIEGESGLSAQFVTYASLTDMLVDENRTGVFTPTNPFGRNIVGSGAFVSTASVPEPQPIALFLLGLTLLVLRNRRSPSLSRLGC